MATTTIDRKQRLALPEQKPRTRDPQLRRTNWDEVSLRYTPEQATAEAMRCLLCPAAPCQKACPLHNDIAGALALLAEGDLSAAAARFHATSPFPELCARLCPQERLCEGACVVGKRGIAVHIGHLERYIADTEEATHGLPPIVCAAHTGHTVAIIGAGPAGLVASEELRRQGHRVVLFDAWPLPGGLLRYGIPTFKLPKALIDAKWAQLSQAGVEFRQGSVDAPQTVQALDEARFDAVLLTVGASASNHLGVPGEDLEGVLMATDFLVRANLPPEELPDDARTPIDPGDHLVVIGGGDTAMDCCRSAVRLGAQEVLCLYRRRESEMPGRRVERQYARDEGVTFEFLASPVRFLGTGGRVTGIECVRMQVTDRDSSGRTAVVPIPDSTFTVPASTVVVAAGYKVAPDLQQIAPGLICNANGTVRIDPQTGATNLPGVYAAGDAVNGADLVVTAAASAYRTTAALNAFLQGLT